MTDTNKTDGAALLPVTQSDGDLTLALIDSLECSTDAPDAPEWAAKFREELADRGFIIARHATQEDAERSERREGFAPCPTCRQYSHSIDDDALANAFMHFEAMGAHPVRGHPMGHIYDDATRDAAQVLVAAAKGASTPQRQEYDGEAVRDSTIEECASIADNWNPGRRDRVTETSIAEAIRALAHPAQATPSAVSE